MSEFFETLPTVQDMLWKCDKRILVSTVVNSYKRVPVNGSARVAQAIKQMCEARIGNPDGVVIVPREKFSTPLFGAIQRVIDVECLDATEHDVVRQGIVGRPWEQVLSYVFWQGDEFTYYDVHDALSLIVKGMLLTGATAQEARINSCLNVAFTDDAPSRARFERDIPFCATPHSATEGKGATQEEVIEEIARLEQEILLARRIGEINSLADKRFQDNVRNLQAYLAWAA